MKESIMFENIFEYIYLIRNQKVMLDFDLAMLYRTETGMLKRQVRRNLDRFPPDFMFQLTKKEWNELMPKWHKLTKLKFTPSLPFVFTEHGVTMLSSVLRSEKAIKVNIEVVRAFIEMRRRLIDYEDILRKLNKLEEKTDNKLFEHESQINIILKQ